MFADTILPTSWVGIASAIVILVLVPFASAVSVLILQKLKQMWQLNGTAPPSLQEKQPVQILSEIHEATVQKEDSNGN